jgi:ribosome maturation factor RimP
MQNYLEQIQKLLDTILEEWPEYFCVSMKIKPTNNYKIFIDGDAGITIERCVAINRKLYKIIEENQWYPDGDFSLEVSSPGVDEPLKLLRQYIKNVGRNVAITLNDDTMFEGKLIEVIEENCVIETIEGKGKKAITHQQTVAINNIKKAIVQIKF